MKKTLKVKSRVRFTAFVLIMLFAVTGLFNTMLGLNDALGLTKQEYIEVNINSGDTLWPNNICRQIWIYAKQFIL